MKFILYIKSNLDNKIKIFDNEFFIQKHENIKTIINFDNYFYLENTPINNAGKYSPSIHKFEICNGQLSCNSTEIIIIKLCKNQFQILITPIKLDINYVHNNYNLNIPDTKEKVIIDNDMLEIQEKNKVFSYKINSSLNNPQIEKHSSTIIIYSKQANKNYILFLIDKRDCNFKKIICHNFKIENGILKYAKKLNDYAKHLKITNFNLNTFSKTETYTAIIKTPRIIKNEKIIPYVFLQNILANDIKECRKYLEEEFSKQLKSKTIKSFFGEFKTIVTPKIKVPANTIGLGYLLKQNFYEIKYFNFEYSNGKIINIQEIENN